MKYNIEQKLETVVKTLKEWEVTKYIFPLKVFFCKVDSSSSIIPKLNNKWELFAEPYLIHEINRYYWFKCEFDIDKISTHEQAFLCIDTFISGVASTIRPQGLLYLNNELIQGIDINHTDVLIKKPGHYEMKMLFYSHTFSFSFPLYFSIKIKDKRIMDAFYDFSVPLDWLKILKQSEKNYKRALPILNEAMNFIDFRNKHSDEFFVSLGNASKFLYSKFYGDFCGGDKIIINCVPHSHIDVAWLWDLEQTKQKVQRTFSTVLELMDEYDDFVYMHTTPQVFEFLKNDNPVLYSKVKDKINSGRFEVEGSMWVEADNNLISGESLVRQIHYGKEFFKREFNKDCSTVFEPDVFGYSAQLPQIMKKMGINRFITAKIGWNDTNRFPFDTFSWEGIDGSRVFTYLITTCDANPRIGVNDTTYTNYVGVMNASQLLGTVNRYQNKDLNNMLLSTIGYGDGGGGPTREMIEKSKRFSYGLPGLGKTKIATLKDTIDDIEHNVKKAINDGKELPIWKGDLYLEFHRGTYTSVPRIKMNNRKAEFALQNCEYISTFTNIFLGKQYPNNIDYYWKLLLLNQFHDIVPGSAIEDVYRDSDKQFKEIFDFTSTYIERAVTLLASNIKGEGYAVFNHNGFKIDAPVEINNKFYIVKNLPSYGYCLYKPALLNTVKLSDKCIENEFLIIKFSECGSIISLFDKKLKKEFVKKGQEINKFVSYEDMPFEYDNWELTPYHFEKAYVINNKATFSPLDEGDRKGFLIKIPYYSSEIIQKVYLYAGLNRIDFITNISWKEQRQVLKVLFPVNMKIKHAQYDIQFGNISRNVKPINSFDEAKFEVIGHKWVDANDGKLGLGLLNNGKYGHHICENIISLTLVKSGSFPYYGASNIVPEFIYSLYPHKGMFNDCDIIEQAYLLNKPTKVIRCKNSKGVLPPTIELFKLSDCGIYIETIKESFNHDGYIIRVVEEHNKEHKTKLTLGFNASKCYICDLEENIIKEIKLDNNSVDLNFKPYEILTLRIK